MRSTRRGVGALSALPLASGLLASCGGSSEGSNDDALRFVLFGDPVETAGYEDLVAAFEEAKYRRRRGLSPGAEPDDLLAKLTTGGLPSVGGG